MPAASKYLDPKQSVPSPKRTSDWDRETAQYRERAFFMAGVTDAAILQEFRDCVDKMSTGDMSGVEARRYLREKLDELGYEPEDSEVGGMQDLSSTQRMRVALETNTALAHGWAQHQEDLRDRRNPAQELYRQHKRQAPRDWQTRWMAAAEAVNFEGVGQGRMVALTTSPIWATLSRFGYPYPPFDFNSGMGTRPVDAETARQLGCFGPPADASAVEAEQGRQQEQAELEANASPNADTSIEIGRLDRDLAEDLQGALKGIAVMEDGLARMLDVNGTRPLDEAEAADMLANEMPEGVPNLQADAYRLYRDSPSALEAEGMEAQQCLLDLVDRVAKTQGTGKPSDAIGRAIAFGDDADADFLRLMDEMDKAGTYTPKEGRTVEAWTAAAGVGQYASGKNNVILISRKYSHRVSAESLDKAIGLLPEPGASLFAGRYGWRVTRKVSDKPNANGGRDITFEVEEY